MKGAIPIFLIIGIHIGLTRLLKVGPPNAEYNSEKRFWERCTSANWDDDGEIEEPMAANNNKKDDKKHPQKENRWLKNDKQCLK